jgi:hypothetical protein
MPTPLAHTYDEKLDLEIGWRLPPAKHLEDSLLGILILHRRTLRAFEPADYVLHLFSFVPNGLTDRNRLKSAPSAVGAGNKPFVEKPFLSLARIGSGM